MSGAELVAWLTAQLDEDEQWATAAGTPVSYGLTDEDPALRGYRWAWYDIETDQEITPDPVRGSDLEADDGGYEFSLRSVEERDSRYGPLSITVPISQAEEVGAAAAGHIVRHDPAAVLADIAAKRLIIAEHGPITEQIGWEDVEICGRCRYDQGLNSFVHPCPTLRLLASAYAHRVGYRQEWWPGDGDQ